MPIFSNQHSRPGRGIFAARDIPARTLLDVSPVLVLEPVENEQHIKHTKLAHYS